MVGIALLGWLKIVGTVIGIIRDLFPGAGLHYKRKLQKTEKVIEAVIIGVDRYNDQMVAPVVIATPTPIKEVIKNVAILTGVEPRLNVFVKRVKAKVAKAMIPKGI